MNKGRLFILSGPSGSGKDTVLKQLLSENPQLKLSISCVTRAMRPGEHPDEKYHFISREQFEKMLAEDAFLEHNVYVGNYYGTPRQPVEDWMAAGSDVLLEIDVNGAMAVKQKMPEAITIFIMPPSFRVLRNRLAGRGTETEKQIQARLRTAVEEIAQARSYDYIVVNDRLEDAIADLEAIIRANALLNNYMIHLIDEVKQDAESCYREIDQCL